MPKFKYVARDRYGVVREDVIYAPDAGAAQMELEKRGFEEIKLQMVTPRQISLDIDIFKPKVKEKDLALFTRQLGAMISAGVGIAEALEILAEQLPNKTLAKALKEVQEDVVAGMSLSKAMAKHKKVFPEFLINLIESAEESGNLDVILQRATTYYEKDSSDKKEDSKCFMVSCNGSSDSNCYSSWYFNLYCSNLCTALFQYGRRASIPDTDIDRCK
ncbi:MAG: type II secretion system F family protein [Persephonella sp.]|nr:type II secretion system F family protein [Persephonella sp.]